jgi:uncharacterized protein
VDWHAIPFNDRFIIYRPRLPLAFIGNQALVRYIERRLSDAVPPAADIEAFLDPMGFWTADPAPPADWAPSEPHLPTTAVLLMTSECNLRCTYCYADGGAGPHLAMTSGIARRVIDAACDNAAARGDKGFELAFHGGGEPTALWPVFTEAVAHAKGKALACDISLTTNGMWNATQRDFILAHVNGVSLSYDGLPAVQDRQRPTPDGRGSAERVLANIGAMDEAGLDYGIRLTATAESFAELPAGIEYLCRQTACRHFQIEPAFNQARGGYADPRSAGAEAFVAGFLAAYEVACEHGRSLKYSGARPGMMTGAFCRAPEHAIVATPEGDLVTCFEVCSRRHPFIAHFTVGSVDEEGVHFDPAALARYAAAQPGRRDRCRGCFCEWQCGGDCAAKCLASGNGEGRCQVNRDITRELLGWEIARCDGVWRGWPHSVVCSEQDAATFISTSLVDRSLGSGPKP